MTLGDRVCVMCDGLKRQCASPLEVYRKPADRFVAGFLGMPPMNFLEGELERANSHIWFVSRDAHLRLDGADDAWLAGEARRPIVMGIRPESFQLADPTEDGHAIPATVQVVEPLGSMMDAHLVLPSGKRLVSRVPAGRLSEGARYRHALVRWRFTCSSRRVPTTLMGEEFALGRYAVGLRITAKPQNPAGGSVASMPVPARLTGFPLARAQSRWTEKCQCDCHARCADHADLHGHRY